MPSNSKFIRFLYTFLSDFKDGAGIQVVQPKTSALSDIKLEMVMSTFWLESFILTNEECVSLQSIIKTAEAHKVAGMPLLLFWKFIKQCVYLRFSQSVTDICVKVHKNTNKCHVIMSTFTLCSLLHFF